MTVDAAHAPIDRVIDQRPQTAMIAGVAEPVWVEAFMIASAPIPGYGSAIYSVIASEPAQLVRTDTNGGNASHPFDLDRVARGHNAVTLARAVREIGRNHGLTVVAPWEPEFYLDPFGGLDFSFSSVDLLQNGPLILACFGVNASEQRIKFAITQGETFADDTATIDDIADAVTAEMRRHIEAPSALSSAFDP